MEKEILKDILDEITKEPVPVLQEVMLQDWFKKFDEYMIRVEDEMRANCSHPEEHREYGRTVYVNSFHGCDQRVSCNLCGDSWWD